MLSRASSTLIHLPLFDDQLLLTRDQFEVLAGPIVERTVAATKSALWAAGPAAATVGAVFLVGGSSRIPLATTALHRAIAVAPTTLEHPETVVAEGAAGGGGPGLSPNSSHSIHRRPGAGRGQVEKLPRPPGRRSGQGAPHADDLVCGRRRHRRCGTGRGSRLSKISRLTTESLRWSPAAA